MTRPPPLTRLTPTADPARSRRWGLPVVAGLAMYLPVPLWDLALERELAQQAVRRACLAAGIQPQDAEVVACRDAIFRALASGHKGSWLFNGLLVAGYVGGTVLLSALAAASVSWITTRIVELHLQRHADLTGLTEDVARASFLSLARQLVAPGAVPGARSPRPTPSAFSA